MSGLNGYNGSRSGAAREGMSPDRIAVVRALNGLGDMLCVVPALRALRSGWPDATISLVGLPSADWFVERFGDYIDELIEFPGFPGIPERSPNVERLPEFLSSVQEVSFDLAVQMHGSGITSNPFATLLNARKTAGFFLPGQFCPDPDLFFPYPADKSEIRRWLELTERLHLPEVNEDLEFPVSREDRQAFQSIQSRHDLRPGAYVCVHPGAAEEVRRWPPERFAAVADELHDHGLQPVLTGTAEEAPLTREVAAKMTTSPVDLAGRTSLGAAAALLEDARLLVANDTGVSHLAAAVATPSVIVFLASDPDRWAPLNSIRHRAVGQPFGRGKQYRCTDTVGHRCLRDGCTAVTQPNQSSSARPSTLSIMDEVRDLIEHTHASNGLG